MVVERVHGPVELSSLNHRREPRLQPGNLLRLLSEGRMPMPGEPTPVASTTTQYSVLGSSTVPAGALNFRLPGDSDPGLVSVTTSTVLAGNPVAILTVAVLSRFRMFSATSLRT